MKFKLLALRPRILVSNRVPTLCVVAGSALLLQSFGCGKASHMGLEALSTCSERGGQIERVCVHYDNDNRCDRWEDACVHYSMTLEEYKAKLEYDRQQNELMQKRERDVNRSGLGNASWKQKVKHIKMETTSPEYAAVLRQNPDIAWLDGFWCTPWQNKHRCSYLKVIDNQTLRIFYAPLNALDNGSVDDLHIVLLASGFYDLWTLRIYPKKTGDLARPAQILGGRYKKLSDNQYAYVQDLKVVIGDNPPRDIRAAVAEESASIPIQPDQKEFRSVSEKWMDYWKAY